MKSKIDNSVKELVEYTFVIQMGKTLKVMFVFYLESEL